MTRQLESGLRVAYVINHYPKVSHSFIRREILALERRGLDVMRIAVRGWNDHSVDPEDAAEQSRTRYLLLHGVGRLIPRALWLAAMRPIRFLRAAGLAMSMWRRSDRTVFHHLAYLVEACELVRWLDREPVSHVHAHFGTNPAEVVMLAHVMGGPPFSFTVHGPEEFDSPVALGLLEKGRRAAFVVAISSFGRSQLFRWLPQAKWGQVEVVHCGLERAFHRAGPTTPSGAARLVCVGRLCEQKGQLLLVEAAATIIGKGVDLDLVLAGDGEMRPQIEAAIDRLGIRSRVRITGWIGSAQVRDEIGLARALVLPSFAEGLPVVIMEAMALRRPVIATYVAGIPELVLDGQTGWMVPAGDLAALASAMEDCLAAPLDRLAAMGDASYTRVLERHDVDLEAGKLASLFRRQQRRDNATSGVVHG